MTWFGYLCDRYDFWQLSLSFYVFFFGVGGWLVHLAMASYERAYFRTRPYLWFFHITSAIAGLIILFLPSRHFICGV